MTTPSPTTLDELVYNVEADRAEIDEIEAGKRDVTEWLEVEVLEIVTVLRRSWDTSDTVPVVDYWELLTAVFGPTVRIIVEPSGQVTVRGYWGGDEVERFTVSHVLAETLAELDPDT